MLFLSPIIKVLEKQGFNYVITARELYRLDQLLAEFGLKNYEIVGRHMGRSTVAKAFGLLDRVARLYIKIRREKPNLCVVGTSPYGPVTARLLGIPSAWVNDNDISWHMINIGARFATRVFLPEHARLELYFKSGLPRERVTLFKGLKEEFYLHDFKKDPRYLKKFGLKKKVAIVRSEPAQAVYYEGGADVNESIIRFLLEQDYDVVFLPRTKEEETKYKKRFPKLFIPPKALHGPNLVANAELVVSGGGTMNREAVVLGTKVLSTYGGQLLGVDEWLVREGYMLHSTQPSPRDVEKLFSVRLKKYAPSKSGLDTVVKGLLNLSRI